MEKAKELYLELEKTTEPKERVRLLLAIAYEFLNTDLTRYELLLKEIHELCIKHKLQRETAEYYNSLGRLHYKRSKFDDAMTAFREAYKLAEQEDLKILQGSVADSIGMVYWTRGDLEMAGNYATEAFNIYETAGDPSGLRAMALNNLGNICERRNELDKALEYYIRSLEILKSVGNERMVPTVRGNLAVIKSRQGQHLEALQEYLTCLEEFRETHNKNAECFTLVNIGTAYFFLNEYARSIEYYLKALKMFRYVDNKKAECEALVGLGDVYTKFGGYDDALKYLQKAIKTLRKMNYPNGLSMALSSIGETYLEMGQTDTALKHLEECRQLIADKGLKSETLRLFPILHKAYNMKGLPDKAREFDIN